MRRAAPGGHVGRGSTERLDGLVERDQRRGGGGAARLAAARPPGGDPRGGGGGGGGGGGRPAGGGAGGADAGPPVGDPGVDGRGEAGRGDLARVDAEDRRTAVREREVVREAGGDAAALGVDALDVLGPQADGRDRARRRGDRERAEAVRLDDRGVAEVRVHVGGRVAVEQLGRVGQRGG